MENNTNEGVFMACCHIFSVFPLQIIAVRESLGGMPSRQLHNAGAYHTVTCNDSNRSMRLSDSHIFCPIPVRCARERQLSRTKNPHRRQYADCRQWGDSFMAGSINWTPMDRTCLMRYPARTLRGQGRTRPLADGLLAVDDVETLAGLLYATALEVVDDLGLTVVAELGSNDADCLADIHADALRH